MKLLSLVFALFLGVANAQDAFSASSGLEYVGTLSAYGVPVAVFVLFDNDGSEALMLVPYLPVDVVDGVVVYVFPSTIYAHSAVTVGFNAFEMD